MKEIIVLTNRSPWRAYWIEPPKQGLQALADAYAEDGTYDCFEAYCFAAGIDLKFLPVEECVPEDCFVIED